MMIHSETGGKKIIKHGFFLPTGDARQYAKKKTFKDEKYHFLFLTV